MKKGAEEKFFSPLFLGSSSICGNDLVFATETTEEMPGRGGMSAFKPAADHLAKHKGTEELQKESL